MKNQKFFIHFHVFMVILNVIIIIFKLIPLISHKVQEIFVMLVKIVD